jgi:dimethylargininase
MRPVVLVRGVAESFAHALVAAPPERPIDVARARIQHAEYVMALASLDVDVVALPADEAYPDCCFVEDTAVVAVGAALLTRPGAPSRRGEVRGVAAALAERCVLVRMEAPATLDGGDCLRAGRTFYVGRSRRTNAEGIARLAAVFGSRGLRVVPVELPAGVLHLKSVCSPLGDDRVLVAEATIPPATFVGLRTIVVPTEEAHAANAVAVGGGAVVAAGCPRTQSLVEAAGFRTVTVDTSETRKADGALTCLSIIIA